MEVKKEIELKTNNNYFYTSCETYIHKTSSNKLTYGMSRIIVEFINT